MICPFLTNKSPWKRPVVIWIVWYDSKLYITRKEINLVCEQENNMDSFFTGFRTRLLALQEGFLSG